MSQDPVLFQYPEDYGWKLMKPAFIPPAGYSINYHPNMGKKDFREIFVSFIQLIGVELFLMGLVSLGLTTVNVLSIFVTAYGVS